jgi:hypothetical protein
VSRYEPINYTKWIAEHDCRRPEREPTVAEMVQSCKENAKEAEARLEHATRWAARAKLDAADQEKPHKDPDYVYAIVEKARAKSDMEHWSEYARYYERELEAEIKAAAAKADARGDRVPGEDDGDAW